LKPEGLIEAALFSAGRAVSIDELEEATQLSPDEIKNSIKNLVKEYENRDSALYLVKVSGKYLMKIRDEYSHIAANLAKTDLSMDVVKTAALIAYHQPMKQKDLYLMLGSKIYEHVKLLRKKELVKAEPSGKTFELTTTNTFLEYFGIEASNKEEMKKVLAKKVGFKVISKVKPEK